MRVRSRRAELQPEFLLLKAAARLVCARTQRKTFSTPTLSETPDTLPRAFTYTHSESWRRVKHLHPKKVAAKPSSHAGGGEQAPVRETIFQGDTQARGDSGGALGGPCGESEGGALCLSSLKWGRPLRCWVFFCDWVQGEAEAALLDPIRIASTAWDVACPPVVACTRNTEEGQAQTHTSQMAASTAPLFSRHAHTRALADGRELQFWPGLDSCCSALQCVCAEAKRTSKAPRLHQPARQTRSR